MLCPVFLGGFLLFVITCYGALIHNDESPLTACRFPDASSLPHIVQPILTSDVETSHSIPSEAEVPSSVACSSPQLLGRLPSSYNPTHISGSLIGTHFTSHAVSSNSCSVFGFEDGVDDLSVIDTLLESWRILEGISEAPLDVHKNPQPTRVIQSHVQQETQNAQNLGNTHHPSGILDHYTQFMTRNLPSSSRFASPSSLPTDLRISASSLGSHLELVTNLTNLNKSGSKERIATSSLMINADKFNEDPHSFQEQLADLRSRDTHKGSARKRKRPIKPNALRFQQFLSKIDRGFVGINSQDPQHRLPCIDEDGSLMFHSGTFSIENPSSMDTLKIQALISMIDGPENLHNQLLILENKLKIDTTYIYSVNCVPKSHRKGMIGSEENEAGLKISCAKARNNNHCRAVTIIHSKIDNWIQFYEAKCGIQFKGLGPLNYKGLGGDVVKTYLVLFLQRVDTISTIIVKEKPITSNKKIMLQNRDILKYAAENFQLIYHQSLTRINNRTQDRPIDAFIHER
jgi:hypothetical protein